MEDIENLITNEELVDSSICSYYNVEEGIYKILFDKYDICYLFVDNDLIYELNDCKSYSILQKIKDLNLNSESINISDHNYLDYNVKLNCRFIDDNKEIFIQMPNEELIFIDKIKYDIIYKLEPNTKYVISNFTKTKYGGIITSNWRKYWVNKRLISILQKYFKCKNNNITCIYDNKEVIPKLTLITEGEDMMTIRENNTNKDITILYQSLKMEIDEKKFTFYINNNDFIDYNKEREYTFSVVYMHNEDIFAYEMNEDKYYHLSYKINDLVGSYVDPKIYDDYWNGIKPDLYTYMISYDDERQGIIVRTVKGYSITYDTLDLDPFFESTLDISLLQENKPKIIYNDDVIIDFD